MSPALERAVLRRRASAGRRSSIITFTTLAVSKCSCRCSPPTCPALSTTAKDVRPARACEEARRRGDRRGARVGREREAARAAAVERAPRAAAVRRARPHRVFPGRVDADAEGEPARGRVDDGARVRDAGRELARARRRGPYAHGAGGGERPVGRDGLRAHGGRVPHAHCQQRASRAQRARGHGHGRIDGQQRLSARDRRLPFEDDTQTRVAFGPRDREREAPVGGGHRAREGGVLAERVALSLKRHGCAREWFGALNGASGERRSATDRDPRRRERGFEHGGGGGGCRARPGRGRRPRRGGRRAEQHRRGCQYERDGDRRPPARASSRSGASRAHAGTVEDTARWAASGARRVAAQRRKTMVANAAEMPSAPSVGTKPTRSFVRASTCSPARPCRAARAAPGASSWSRARCAGERCSCRALRRSDVRRHRRARSPAPCARRRDGPSCSA